MELTEIMPTSVRSLVQMATSNASIPQTEKNSNTPAPEFLTDKRPNGEPKPWRRKKPRSLKSSDSYRRQGDPRRADRIEACGSELEFTTDLETSERFLSYAHFCRERLCPMCQWRKSLRVFWEVSNVMDAVQKQRPGLTPLFFTIAMRNCKDDDLPAALNQIFAGWKNLMKDRAVKPHLVGWFRTLEVTYDGDKKITWERYHRKNKDGKYIYKAYYDRRGIKPGDENPNYNTFHPHIHAIFLVDQAYFNSGNYIELDRWIDLWARAGKFDYKPTVDIKKIKNPKADQKDLSKINMNEIDHRKAVSEVAKYTLKDTEYITNDDDLTDRLVAVYSRALKGRRLYAYGGELKKIAKSLFGGTDSEAADLVHFGDRNLRADVAALIERYRWMMGFSNYVKVYEYFTNVTSNDLTKV